jgi:hypothetical protein
MLVESLCEKGSDPLAHAVDSALRIRGLTPFRTDSEEESLGIELTQVLAQIKNIVRARLQKFAFRPHTPAFLVPNTVLHKSAHNPTRSAKNFSHITDWRT